MAPTASDASEWAEKRRAKVEAAKAKKAEREQGEVTSDHTFKPKTRFPPDSKATVKHTDMPNDMKTEVVDIIAGSIDKFTLPTGVNFEGATRAIKDALDKSYGFNWHCAMGKGFCFDVTAQNGTLMHCYYQGELAILVYKSGKLRASLSGSGKVTPVAKSDLTSPVLRRRPGDAVALAMPEMPEASSSLQAPTSERRLTDSTPEKMLPAPPKAQPDRSGQSARLTSLTRRSEGDPRPAPPPKSSGARAKKAPARPKAEGVARAFAKSSSSSSKPLAGSSRTSQQGSRAVASHSKAEVRDLTPRSDVPSWPQTPGARLDRWTVVESDSFHGFFLLLSPFLL
ncbi:Dynein light chain 4, axonemal [Symbiodinium microadriaticum]|uniref:Dynein light chain 4, axonemal n=1 Tax=Symbiodinium microadriaticum TaxID=2951 RepID=A0A1Q9DD44_SYMMI|nr:Dynein light chain 4, axonemal [Symbiodinium microadriaticum]